MLKFEFEKGGLGNEDADNKIKITQLKKILRMNDTIRLKQLVKKN